MLDLTVVTPPTHTAINVVSVSELARHLRLSPTLSSNATMIQTMNDAITEVVDGLDGRSGILNRTILPRVWKRTLKRFPASGEPILIPYPDLIQLQAITIEDGSSPANVLAESDYVIRQTLVPEVHAASAWPSISDGTLVTVTYRAGYTDYPPALKRLVKILAAHYIENPEATINEPRQMQINRKITFGFDQALDQLRIPVSYDDWGE